MSHAAQLERFVGILVDDDEGECLPSLLVAGAGGGGVRVSGRHVLGECLLEVSHREGQPVGCGGDGVQRLGISRHSGLKGFHAFFKTGDSTCQFSELGSNSILWVSYVGDEHEEEDRHGECEGARRSAQVLTDCAHEGGGHGGRLQAALRALRSRRSRFVTFGDGEPSAKARRVSFGGGRGAVAARRGAMFRR